MIEFRPISASETYDARRAVLWPDKPLSHLMVEGDEGACHYAAFEEGDLLGTASFFGGTSFTNVDKRLCHSKR